MNLFPRGWKSWVQKGSGKRMKAFDSMFTKRVWEATLERRHKNARCAYYARRFGLNESQQRNLRRTVTEVDQLDECKDDAARRLILGLSS